MGIVNATPDSFSDGGEHSDPRRAVEHGRRLLDEGADILDIGGESTRPGAQRVPAAVELGRVVPVVAELAAAGAVVSVDTMRAEVAQAAVGAGASIINDVSGGLADPAMLETVAGLGVGFVTMHWPGHPGGDPSAGYGDVVEDVRRDLAQRVDAALAAGVAADQLVVDPGLGFSKSADHNWTLLRHLDAFAELGCPLLVGASRKRFLGELLARDGAPRPAKGRDDATVALTAILASRGVWGVRVHNVLAQRDAIAVVERLDG
ncbi:MAG: dihydropteroate synthase [Propionibacteriaceae bacterium]|jgi:dihydropteroate synthase|nr:dihydropteroate synthase [Propionibacteriaceae bacterium]